MSDSDKSKHHLEQTFAKLDNLREERKYCDIVFVGDEGCELHAHKNVISTVTQFFDASCNFKAENDKITRIKLEDLDLKESVLKKILEIIYFKAPHIDKNEAVDVLFAADKLLMDRIIEYVGEYMVDNDYLDEIDHIFMKVCYFPGLEKCDSLLNHMEFKLSINFWEVSQLSEFYEFPIDILCRLNVFKKAESFEYPEIGVNFIVKWLMYDIDNRIDDIKAIIEYLSRGPNESDSSVNHVIDPDAVDTFFSIITEARGRNVNDPGTLINLLRLSLRGLLSESIRAQWDSYKTGIRRWLFAFERYILSQGKRS